jgi:hypothetical protein
MIPRHLKIAVIVMLGVVLAMGFYLRHLKRSAAQLPSGSENLPVAPPVSGPTEKVALYVAYDTPGMLVARPASIPLPSDRQERAQAVLRALLAAYTGEFSTHPIAPGSEVKSVYLVPPGIAVVDLNPPFADGHRSGILVEELTVLSLVQTLAVNVPGVTRVKFLIDGKMRETLAGHASLADFYDVAKVKPVVEQLLAAP